MYNLYNLSAALLPAQGAYCVSTQPQGVGDKKGSGRAHRAVTAGERVDLRAHQLRVRLRQGPAAQQVGRWTTTGPTSSWTFFFFTIYGSLGACRRTITRSRPLHGTTTSTRRAFGALDQLPAAVLAQAATALSRSLSRGVFQVSVRLSRWIELACCVLRACLLGGRGRPRQAGV